ncbi:XRE family transcriptional regulator [Pseudazoarcus pumilus]|uniref:HTH cro/C1-type domain-containing protein n=1 Tax=Pseudazoarcus pumilus TaxID=2067960 RepID=A0A2I6S9H6_9RHOO|nr:S24 family peptidase [Pseudazoarcus pumilus]AUN95908.1 hypothetical protein C0099_13780 [Pseudazoarcus pumilus]
MTVGNRIREARTRLGLSQPEASSKSGIPLGTLRKYEHDSSLPGAEAITGFVRLGVNSNWLLTGEGPMLLSDTPLAERAAPLAGSSEETVSTDDAGYVAVALYNGIHAAAGHGAVAGTETPDDALMFKEDWIRFELGAKPADLCLIRVSGDSMEPTLRAGDVILVDRRAQQPDREGIYILRMDDMLLVKRLQALPGGVLQVSSDNAAFATWTLKVSELEANAVHIIGRVVWAGRRF